MKITGKRRRVLVLSPDKKGQLRLLHRVPVAYARRAIKRGEARLSEYPDCIIVDGDLRELTGREKRLQHLAKQKGER